MRFFLNKQHPWPEFISVIVLFLGICHTFDVFGFHFPSGTHVAITLILFIGSYVLIGLSLFNVTRINPNETLHQLLTLHNQSPEFFVDNNLLNANKDTFWEINKNAHIADYPNRILKELVRLYKNDPQPWINSVGQQEIELFIEMIERVSQSRCVGIVETFADYCTQCKIMLKRSEKGSVISTVQTSTPIGTEDTDKPFELYLEETIDLILKVQEPSETHYLRGYKRLIILDKDRIDDIMDKIDMFIDILFEKLYLLRKKEINPSLNILTLGFIKKETAAEFFYSNVDILITSDWLSSVVFQAPDNSDTWAACVYIDEKLLENETAVLRKKLVNGFDILWGKCIKHPFSTGYNQDNGSLDKQKSKILKDITKIITPMVN